MRIWTLTVLTLFATSSFADEGAQDYRHHTMEAVGGHMQALVDILMGKVPHQGHLALHAGSIAELAAITGTLFPEGSVGGDSLPAIWEQPEDFAARVAKFQETAEGLRDTIAAGGEVGPAVQALGEACKGCHENYRNE